MRFTVQRHESDSMIGHGFRAVLGGVCCIWVIAFAPDAPAASQRLIDQIVALVNNEPITGSDLLWSLALAPEAPNPAGQLSQDLLRQKLDVMIDERLIAQEASRIPAVPISQEEVDAHRTQLIARFPSEAAFRDRVESVGLTAERIDELIRQRIQIDRFIEFRFRSFVFVSEQEIERYYEEELAPEIRRKGAVPPPLDQVREMILEKLRGDKIEAEIDGWLRETRQRAEIVHLAEP